MTDPTLTQLPLDILINIMGNLTVSDLRNLMLTCKALRNLIVNENSIWRLVSHKQLVLHNTSDNSQTDDFSWYHRCRISHNWCKGIYRSKIVLYHQTSFMPWLKTYNSQAIFLLALGSELHCFPTNRKGFPLCKDLMWKLQVPKVRRLDVRTNDISRFVAKGDLIVCGNRDGCVAVYKMDNTKRKPWLLYHIKDCHENGELEVTAVELIHNNQKPYVVTASEDSAKLCFWCLNNTEDVPILNNIGASSSEITLGEDIGIRCLHAHRNGDKLAIGLHGNNKPLLLDVASGTLLINPERADIYKQAVRDIYWHNDNTMMYVTHSGVLQLMDIRSGQVVFDAMDPFQSTLYCVKSDGHRAIVVGSAEYSRCVLFDARCSRRHVQMYFTQKKSSPIYSLDFDSTKLIAAADRSVAVLNFNIDVKSAPVRDYSHTFEVIDCC